MQMGEGDKILQLSPAGTDGVVLQHEVSHLQSGQLPDTAEANGEVVEEVQRLVQDTPAGGPVLQVGHTCKGVGEGGGRVE